MTKENLNLPYIESPFWGLIYLKYIIIESCPKVKGVNFKGFSIAKAGTIWGIKWKKIIIIAIDYNP